MAQRNYSKATSKIYIYFNRNMVKLKNKWLPVISFKELVKAMKSVCKALVKPDEKGDMHVFAITQVFHIESQLE